MPKTNLSLGNLYRAVSGSTRVAQAVSIGGLGGTSAGSNTAFSSFAIESVQSNLPTFTYIVESTDESASFSFGSPGTLHGNKVATVSNNYTCSFGNANFTVPSSTLGATPSFTIRPAGVGVSSYSEASSTLTMAYADGFNINATNYGTTSTKILYAVDVYNTINQPDFCLLFGTKAIKGDGTEINVEDLQIGDSIKAWVPTNLPDESLDTESELIEWRFHMLEENTGEAQNVLVSDLVFNFASGYFSINDGLIKATGTHPLWVFDNEIGKFRFKLVEDILPGDRLIKYDDVSGIVEIEVTNIEIVEEDVEIVTINVEQSDVYISNGLISHNKGTTTQPYIPSTGLRMYLEPAKTASFAAGTLPSTGTPTVDILDMSGWGTGVRPRAQSPLATGSNPSYNNGTLRKDKYYVLNGTDQAFYKDSTSNISGGISQFNVTAGTVHMWIRPTTTLGTSTRRLFDYNGFYGMAVESTDNSALNRLKFYSSTLGDSAQVTTSLSSNVWYLISVAFGSGTAPQFYVDGVSVGSLSASATISAPTSSDYVVIGANDGFTSFWNGQVGPVLFYNIKQTSTEVDQLYDYFSPIYK
jgi:hypothetical protein